MSLWMHARRYLSWNPLFRVLRIFNNMSKTQDIHRHLETGLPLLGELTTHDDMTVWMSRIPDSTKISLMTVPGTHDSAAYNYQKREAEWWNCQSTSLFRQLDAGIRALDIRYAIEENKLLIVHSKETLDSNAQVGDIIWGLHRWLQLHPTETIFVSLKYDRPDDDNKETERQRRIQEVLNQTSSLWVDNVTTRTTLGEARGKLILIRRFLLEGSSDGFDVSRNWGVNSGDFKINLPGNTFAQIEDLYLFNTHSGDAKHHLGEKWKATKAHLERARTAISEKKDDTLWITFTSAVGDKRVSKDENVTPRVMALGRGDVQGVNQHLLAWSKENRVGHLGIVLMDFVSTQRKSGSDTEEETDAELIRELVNRQSLVKTAQ